LGWAAVSIAPVQPRRKHGTASSALRGHGKDGAKLQGYYAELFGWEIDANNPMKYGVVQREGNVSPEGHVIGVTKANA
jgi:hypothetical protein